MAELLLRQIAESLMILGQKASRRKPSLLDRGGVKHRLAKFRRDLLALMDFITKAPGAQAKEQPSYATTLVNGLLPKADLPAHPTPAPASARPRPRNHR